MAPSASMPGFPLMTVADHYISIAEFRVTSRPDVMF